MKRVLVIGDIIVDIHTEVEPLGVSAETPCMVVRRKEQDERRQTYDTISFGGAGLVVRNLLRLGCVVDFLTLVGSGDRRLPVLSWSEPKLSIRRIFDGSRPVTTKQRFWAGTTKLFQVDTRTDDPIEKPLEDAAIEQFDQLLFAHKYDAIVIADYRHGFITQRMAEKFCSSTLPVFASSQVSQNTSNHHWYENARCIVANDRERQSNPIFDAASSRHTFTDGPRGSWRLCRRGFHLNSQPPEGLNAVDTCGAGDAFLAAYAIGNDLDEMGFANLWAGLSTTMKGAHPPTKAMLLKWLKGRELSPSGPTGEPLSKFALQLA